MVDETIHASFAECARRNPDRPALLVRDRGRGRYVPISYEEVSADVERAADSLSRLGLSKGDAVGILSANRPEWVIADLACMKLGAVVVPIYSTLSPATIKYIIADSRMKMLLVENSSLLRMISEIRTELDGCWKCIVIEKTEDGSDPSCIPFDVLLQPRETVPAGGHSVSPDDVATIVYTSGTTGEPKGVVLTHRNIVANTRAVAERYGLGDRDIVLSYLPLCHMFERTCGYYALLFSGASIAYAESISTVLRDALSVRPTLVLAVPRVVEKAFEQAAAQVSRGSRLARWLIARTIKDLNARADLRYNRERVGPWLRLRCLLLDRMIASQFRKIGGGRLRILAVGGAPLDRKVAKTYYLFGYNIVEGYGLTETSPVVCSNSVSENTLGTVGKPLRNVEVRIGENEEVLVRGPSVMRGYIGRPDETARAIDAEGWLHTGDQGRFDDKGNLVITGRIKDLIVTSYGKKVPAAAIEGRICRSGFISQAMLYGDRCKYIVALIVPSRPAVERFATETGIESLRYEDLLADGRIHALIEGEIEKATVDLAPYEKVKAFALVPEEFSIVNGLLTPLMKLRRVQVVERYRDRIASMYAAAERSVR